MPRHPVTSSMSVRAMAAVVAFGLTGVVLVGVETLAQQRTVSPYAPIVQLERVVITGQRLSAIDARGLSVARDVDHCDTARDLTSKAC